MIKKGLKQIKIIISKNPLVLILIESLFLFALTIFLFVANRKWIFICFFLVFVTALIVIYKLNKKKNFTLDLCLVDFINSIIFSTAFSFFLGKYILEDIDLTCGNVLKYGILLLLFLTLLIPMIIYNSFHRIKRKKAGLSSLLYLSFTFSIVYLFFYFFFDLPFELFLNNYSEFSFSFFDVLYSLYPFVIIAIIIIAFSLVIPYFSLSVFDIILTWMSMAFYFQCMFFNRYIGKIHGAKYIWKNHIGYTFLNIIFWMLVLVAVIFVSLKFKKNKDKIWIFVKMSLFIMGMASFLFSIIKAPKEVFARRQMYLEGSEQFTVGSEGNVIILIADAVDNSFVKELLENDPKVFGGFNDFTLYTNTCSVYDGTATSVPQMLYGDTQVEGSNKSEELLKRFKENNFRILFYNIHAISANSGSYVSSYVPSEETEDVSNISYDLIKRYLLLISTYMVSPCIVKSLIPIDIIDFEKCIVYQKNKSNLIIHNNNEFEENLCLRLNGNATKCFIYQHLDGAHLPCDDYVDETKHCLMIFQEYIRQLKQLGIYDNSVIIIASDHGIHDGVNGLPYGIAATPMFIVKKCDEHHNSIQVSDKPIYYREFMPTILQYAGLFDLSSDYQIFGKSIDDYETDEIRTRVWFDGSFETNTFRKYKYTGDTKEFERVVNSGEFIEVDSLEYDYSDLD